MKKNSLFCIIISVILLSSVYTAHAQLVPTGGQIQTSFRNAVDIISGALTPIFEVLLGTQNDQYFFAKVLLVMLLFMIIYFALGRTKAFGLNKGALFVVSAIVALLAIRYLPENDLIAGILLPYGTIGIAITTFLPFLIYFFFVHQSVPGTVGRRLAWIVYGIAFIALTILRWGEISVASSWMYVSGLIVLMLAVIFDKTIHGYFGMFETERFLQGAHNKNIASLQAEYNGLLSLNTKAATARRAAIEKQLREANAEVPGS